MTQAEKAMAYDEALGKAEEFYNDKNNIQCVNVEGMLEEIFPELKESEDEEIRKGLIKAFGSIGKKEWGGVNVKNALAWLEKQGEKKPVEWTEKKFEIGDEIQTDNEEPLTITRIDENGYWSENLFICNFDDSAKWELVEQKSVWSEEDDYNVQCMIAKVVSDIQNGNVGRNQELIDWLKSLKQRIKKETV